MGIEKEFYGEIFNITDEQETSWKEYFTRLAEMAAIPVPRSLSKDELKVLLQLPYQGRKLFGKMADILPDSIDFISRSYAYSIAKAETILVYKPKIDLKQGMERTQEWLQKTDIRKLIELQ